VTPHITCAGGSDRTPPVHMSPLFAARPSMLLTAVVSLNVETAAILTAASILSLPREQGSIKGRVLLLMATFR
jgi:hypothetical protein